MKKRAGIIFVTALFMAVFCVLFTGTSLQAKSVKLNRKLAYLAPKKTLKLKVTGTKKKVVWKSSNKKVATVSKKGKVRARKTGKAVIVAKVGSKKLKCKIIVEKKEKTNARKLRNYIVKKGKAFKDIDEKTYYTIEYSWVDEESNEHSITASAYKNKYTFIFNYSQLPRTTAGARYSYKMSIDPVNKKSGRFDNDYEDPADIGSYRCWGSISTAFNGNKGSGLKVKGYYDVDSEGGETLVPNSSSYSTQIGKKYKEAFEEYDKLLKKKKTGVTMKSIGFKNWK